jgi:glycerol-3-phosphate dehydrogenase (NAD(P)+)
MSPPAASSSASSAALPAAVPRVAVLGAGAWGTALAIVAMRAGCETVLWARRPEAAQALNEARENKALLPGAVLPEGLRVVSDLPTAVLGADFLLLATPAQHVRGLCSALAPYLGAEVPLLICAKGIEMGTGRLLSAVVEEALAAVAQGQGACSVAGRIGVLSGPAFAHEVAAELPTAVTLAIKDQLLGARLQTALGSRRFRPYLCDDPIGAQIGGAVKNVLAIACGIIVGKGWGENARAALLTRGLAEMTRLGCRLGGKAETLMGLSGLGDLVLTCSSLQSRNMSLGAALGQGKRLEAIMAERRSVSEGVYTAAAVMEVARAHAVDMPICAAVEALLYQGADLDAVMDGLMSRPFTVEGR